MAHQDGSVLALGTRIDQYVVSGVLGRGGFGITYLVRDEALGKDFALKEFFPYDFVQRESAGVRVRAKPDNETEYRWGLRKFYDEARLLVQFSHPNIVGVRRVFEANDSAYMLLDLIKGKTLEKWLQDLGGPPSQEELDLIVGPLLSALELAHENRTWHLDISPENVMIRGADGAPILLDFGASRFEIRQRSDVMSAMVYKSGYSAPEQYSSNANRYGPWTDIYAVGATLYRAISGSRPTEAPVRLLKDEQTSVAKIAAKRYRDKFLNAIDWALKLPPEERPQSVAVWRTALFDPQSKSASAKPPRTSKAALTPPARIAALPSRPVQPVAPAKSPMRALLLFALLSFAVAGAAILATPSLRCMLPGMTCPTIVADIAVDKLRACLDEKRAGAPCTARSCLAAYAEITASTPAWPRIEQTLIGVDKACQDQDDAAARRARACADARQTPNAQCEIASVCFAPYLADHPNGRARSDFEARSILAARDCEAAGAVDRQAQAEDRLFDTAAACAAASDGCRVPVCFDAYLTAHPAGRHASKARAAIAAARCARSALIANGVYLARTQPGCDARAQSVRISVTDGRVAWLHDAQGTAFQWEGSLDGDGEVRATVRGLPGIQAKGRWHDADRFIEMEYPQCGKVMMTIYQMLRQ